jgi:predicted MFS family arabinose efflux permease
LQSADRGSERLKPDRAAGYGALLRVPGFARLYAGILLGRMGNQMMIVTLVLFVLGRYHSPQLAGLTAFLGVFPGLLLAPLAGALLDRRGRALLMSLDYLIAAVTAGLIAGLAALNALPPPALLTIVGIASLTNPLSSTGARSLVPMLAPPHLWERANALDSSGYVISSLVASPLAGTLVGVFGGEWALAATGAVFAAAAVVMLGLPDPAAAPHAGGSVVRNAWLGLRYVMRNPTLRGLALTLSMSNIGGGILIVALPFLVLNRLHQGPATVGFLWGGEGAAGLISVLIVGRLSSQGRERQLVLIGIAISVAALGVLPFSHSLLPVVVAVLLFGVANGPFDIGLFTLRQRRTDPAWFGRAFAVSMALNYVGLPIGSALAGPLIGWSLDAALWTAVVVSAVAGLFPMLAIPRGDDAAVPVS